MGKQKGRVHNAPRLFILDARMEEGMMLLKQPFIWLPSVCHDGLTKRVESPDQALMQQPYTYHDDLTMRVESHIQIHGPSDWGHTQRNW